MLFPIICFACIFLNERLIALFLFFDDAAKRKILPTIAAPPAEANTIYGVGLWSPISFSNLAPATPIKAATSLRLTRKRVWLHSCFTPAVKYG